MLFYLILHTPSPNNFGGRTPILQIRKLRFRKLNEAKKETNSGSYLLIAFFPFTTINSNTPKSPETSEYNLSHCQGGNVSSLCCKPHVWQLLWGSLRSICNQVALNVQHPDFTTPFPLNTPIGHPSTCMPTNHSQKIWALPSATSWPNPSYSGK